jgi:hypothetical protein
MKNALIASLIILLVGIWLSNHLGASNSTLGTNNERLLRVIAILETGHMPENARDRAVSPAGAIGRHQIMPFWAKDFGYTVADLYNPKVNRYIASKIVLHLHKKYGHNPEKILAAYNGWYGQANLPQSQRCRETWNYVKRGLKLYYELP